MGMHRGALQYAGTLYHYYLHFGLPSTCVMPLKAFHKIYDLIYTFPLIIIVGNAYLCLPTLKPIQNSYHFSDTRTKKCSNIWNWYSLTPCSLLCSQFFFLPRKGKLAIRKINSTQLTQHHHQ